MIQITHNSVHRKWRKDNPSCREIPNNLCAAHVGNVNTIVTRMWGKSFTKEKPGNSDFKAEISGIQNGVPWPEAEPWIPCSGRRELKPVGYPLTSTGVPKHGLPLCMKETNKCNKKLKRKEIKDDIVCSRSSWCHRVHNIKPNRWVFIGEPMKA